MTMAEMLTWTLRLSDAQILVLVVFGAVAIFDVVALWFIRRWDRQ